MLRHLAPFALIAIVEGGSCASQGSPPAAVPPGQPVSESQCVEDWIAKNHLNQYGDADGTMYAGGTPLFDEASGQTRDRLQYIFEKHPEAKTACKR
jgi:hypothetical protein